MAALGLVLSGCASATGPATIDAIEAVTCVPMTAGGPPILVGTILTNTTDSVFTLEGIGFSADAHGFRMLAGDIVPSDSGSIGSAFVPADGEDLDWDSRSDLDGFRVYPGARINVVATIQMMAGTKAASTRALSIVYSVKDDPRHYEIFSTETISAGAACSRG